VSWLVTWLLTVEKFTLLARPGWGNGRESLLIYSSKSRVVQYFDGFNGFRCAFSSFSVFSVFRDTEVIEHLRVKELMRSGIDRAYEFSNSSVYYMTLWMCNGIYAIKLMVA